MGLTIKLLVKDNVDHITTKSGGVTEFFKESQFDKLELLYCVFRRDETTFGKIIAKMTPYIHERGAGIV